jgi:hypothetical protein
MKVRIASGSSDLFERALLAYGVNVHDGVLLTPEARTALIAELCDWRKMPPIPPLTAEVLLNLKWRQG